MRQFNIFLSLLLVFQPLMSYGQLKESQKQDVTAEINLMKNGGFENGLAGWTKDGSSTLTKDTASPLAGKASAIWDASAASETLVSSLQTVKDGMKNRNNCSVSGLYSWDSGVQDDIEIQAYDGSSVIASYKPSPTTGTVKPITFPFFTCPSSGSLQVRLVSAANAASIELDNVYIGSGRNTLFAVPKNEIVTQFLSSSATSDGAMADLTFNNLEVGKRYDISGLIDLAVNVGAVNANVRVDAIHDGTVVYRTEILINDGGSSTDQVKFGVDGSFTATTSTLEFVAVNASANSFVVGDGSKGSTFIQLEERNDLGGNFQEGLTPETSGWHVDVNIGGGNAALSNLDVNTYTDITNSTLDLVTNTGSSPAQIACATGTASSGSTCSGGSEAVGVVADVPSAGRYKICGEFSHTLIPVGPDGQATTVFQWAETSNLDNTIIQAGNSRVQHTQDIANDGTANIQVAPYNLCGQFIFGSAGQRTLRLMYEQSITVGTVSSSSIPADRAAAFGDRDIHITIEKMDEQQPTPIFTALQNSLNSKIEAADPTKKVKFASITGTCGGAPSIATEVGVASIGAIVTGDCLITLDDTVTTWHSCYIAPTSPSSTANYSVHGKTSNTVKSSCTLSGGSDCTSYVFEMGCSYE